MSYTLDQLYGIRDQVIVVTGAAGGIGLELCRAIRDLGGRVAAVVRNSKSREKVLEALHCPNLSTEKDVLCVIADLTHEEAVKAAMEQIDRHFGRIDGLVNAAGMNTIVGYVYDMLYGNGGGYPSYASAAAIILFVIVLTITCINLLVSKKHVYYS